MPKRPQSTRPHPTVEEVSAHGCSVVLVELLEEVLVLVVVLVVVGGTHPDVEHDSQQLVKFPAHAVPPRGATHAAALSLMLQVVLPLLVWQHVTEPGFPHVDLLAQSFTNAAQLLLRSAAVACFAAQLT